jgi:hypothetical protein
MKLFKIKENYHIPWRFANLGTNAGWGFAGPAGKFRGGPGQKPGMAPGVIIHNLFNFPIIMFTNLNYFLEEIINFLEDNSLKSLK